MLRDIAASDIASRSGEVLEGQLARVRSRTKSTFICVKEMLELGEDPEHLRLRRAVDVRHDGGRAARRLVAGSQPLLARKQVNHTAGVTRHTGGTEGLARPSPRPVTGSTGSRPRRARGRGRPAWSARWRRAGWPSRRRARGGRPPGRGARRSFGTVVRRLSSCGESFHWGVRIQGLPPSLRLRIATCTHSSGTGPAGP